MGIRRVYVTNTGCAKVGLKFFTWKRKGEWCEKVCASTAAVTVFSFSAYLYACIPIGHFSSIDIVFGYVI